MDTTELYLLIWDIQNTNDNSSVGHIKIVEEFNNIQEAQKYFDEVTKEMLDKIKETNVVSDGGTIISLRNLISESKYRDKYKIIKEN